MSHVNIPACVRKSYDDFCKLRGKCREEFTVPFWDVVVLTTSDADQQMAFELQIEQKKARKEIPLVPYHVYPDPPGPKAGCGTSTMYVICELKKIYQEKLRSYRVLILNCGGQSQRLPSASILGKVFMALPLGDPVLSLFELKLFSYLPFLPRMAPGFFHPASDTIEVFDLGEEDSDWTFERPGFTAIAHPSPLEIGATHGVYVLQENGRGSKGTGDSQNGGTSPVSEATGNVSEATGPLAEMRSCLFVLQKPHIDTMRERGAVLMDKSTNKEFVYTDSAFFFDHDIGEKFIEFYEKESPFECEIDAYADFLQSLGPQATGDFTNDLRNVSKVEPRLVEIRTKVFELLKGTPINVIALDASTFYHLGTMKEYIHHFCVDDVFHKHLSLSRIAFCKITEESQVNEDESQANKRPRVDDNLSGCLIHSIITRKSVISSSAIVEFCHFTSDVHIGENCIISSCQSDHQESLTFPSNTFMHTAAIMWPKSELTTQKTGFVTIAFHIADDIKKKVGKDEIGSQTYFQHPLRDFCKITGVKTADIYPETVDTYNLWYARLFPVCTTMAESFRVALDVLHGLTGQGSRDPTDYPLVSMADILDLKDAAAMLDYRKNLYEMIRG